MHSEDDLERVGYQAYIEESAEELYEHAPCGYLSTSPGGTIVKINTTLLNWLGYAPSEILNRCKLQDLMTIGGKIYYETHFGPLIQMQGYVKEVTFDLRTKEGKILPVLLNTRLVNDAEGNPLLYRTTIFDITDRKVYEQELLRAKKEAEAAAKVKAEFLSTVSHEIRTPLNAIISIANLLQGTNHTTEQKEYFRTLKFSADNLMHLINDILDYSKIESGRVELAERNLNLREMVESLLYGLSITAEEKGLSLKAKLDKKLPQQLIGDPIKITQVLTNLLSNAIKFTDKGSVSLGIEVLGMAKEEVFLGFQVKDTGIGIQEDKLERIFTEFTQADYSINLKYGGTGLGLSISQKLLALYGSELTVESEVGHGTTFSFKLRLKVAEPQAAEDTSIIVESEDEPDVKDVKLLLVEDNPVNVLVISKYFDKWGIDYDVATNGAEAVDQVLGHNYALVLMDLQMPVMDGYEATKEIRKQSEERFKQLPIIALSASAQHDYRDRMEDAGMNDFVGKPFDPLELRTKIAHYARLHGAHKPMPVNEVRAVDFATRYSAPAEGEAFTLQNFEHLLEDNEQDLQELVRMNVRNFETIKKQLINALLVQDVNGYKVCNHKISMTLEILCADELRSAIDFGKELLENNSQNIILIRQTSIRITKEFNLIINGLKEVLQTRWKSSYLGNL